ncbi:hypothetical protein ANN_17615 [Periplaneta americana]|uniref:CCHC-type domain-containing protein n=1 Tax=Periplaneta americana TaxID=6978 RepID=A0ABQ8STF3_PERAM|nr:hypothetical protein ANN_17615 [Periplaneta americana]
MESRRNHLTEFQGRVFGKVIPDSDKEATLHHLKRKRTRERKNATRFITEIDAFTDDTSLDDLEYFRDRLQETLSKLGTLDDAIHDLLLDSEYDDDLEKCSGTAPTQASITHSVRLPPIKLQPFSGDVETWARFWEQFESSIDKNPSLSTINKHTFLRGYLEDEPKQFVDGIPVISETYEETKKILRTRFGDKNRIIQAHLDYLEDVKPIRIATPDALNTTYIECHRRMQALRALGEDVNGYGRIVAPKILRAFPDDICRRWIIHVKRENLSEGDILKLMEFLGEEVDAALTTQKIRGDAFSSTYIPTTATLRVDTKTGSRSRKSRSTPDPFCVFCESRGHWAQDCKVVPDASERVKRLKNDNRCFLCLNRGHSSRNCSRKGKALCTHCKMSHHRSICSNPRSTEPTTDPTKFTSTCEIFDEEHLDELYSVTGFESTHAFCPQPAVPNDVKMLAHTRKLQLAEPKDHTEDMTLAIEILIGGDHYWKVVKDSSPIRISPTMVLIPSKLGWILSGNRSGITIGSTIVNYIHSEQGSDMSSDTFYIDHRDITETLLEGPASKRQLLRVTSLQETMVKDRDKKSQLHQELAQLKSVAPKYVSLQEEYYQLKEQCLEQEQTLEEIGNKLSISKLQVVELKEEATRNIAKGNVQWISDKEITHCKVCSKEFNITRRRSNKHRHTSHLRSREDCQTCTAGRPPRDRPGWGGCGGLKTPLPSMTTLLNYVIL